MSDVNSPDSIPKDWTVRRFQPDDANGVTRLVEAIYGSSYYPPALYDPQQIVHLNEVGRLISVLALEADDVIGHYAMERWSSSPIAEASDAIVALHFRHHHVFEDMRVMLVEVANHHGLTGLVGYPVTNHVFSQKAEEHFGAAPCGIAPGLWPRSFHNMPEPLTQRMSFVIYFKYLKSVNAGVHVVTPHHEMLSRIAQQWGLTVRPLEPAAATEPSELSVEREPEVETATIRVRRAGADSAAAVRQSLAQALQEGAQAIELELPLAQPATAELCREAEAAGFFFSGLGPAFAADGDALLLQYLAEDIDPTLIQVANPFARELLDYVDRERQRAHGLRRA
jgi:hypothetical protein